MSKNTSNGLKYEILGPITPDGMKFGNMNRPIYHELRTGMGQYTDCMQSLHPIIGQLYGKLASSCDILCVGNGLQCVRLVIGVEGTSFCLLRSILAM